MESNTDVMSVGSPETPLPVSRRVNCFLCKKELGSIQYNCDRDSCTGMARSCWTCRQCRCSKCGMPLKDQKNPVRREFPTAAWPYLLHTPSVSFPLSPSASLMSSSFLGLGISWQSSPSTPILDLSASSPPPAGALPASLLSSSPTLGPAPVKKTPDVPTQNAPTMDIFTTDAPNTDALSTSLLTTVEEDTDIPPEDVSAANVYTTDTPTIDAPDTSLPSIVEIEEGTDGLAAESYTKNVLSKDPLATVEKAVKDVITTDASTTDAPSADNPVATEEYTDAPAPIPSGTRQVFSQHLIL
ncbi:hypothetical protein BC936DRAFT_148961 [Jimgerdemannia flammicorona]|uniref:Uncharacterized protein n=1 Tax=Jimgerdemannia flammicorona TaxID=994334 RepID=A0A433D1X2_9FUNG|nr:hypothetical protein BC936DRAFT_148961 [Jimgerdemannia flammicorona]